MLIFTGDINLTGWYYNAVHGIETRIGNGIDPFHNINRSPKGLWVGDFEGVVPSVSINNGFHSEVFRVAPEVLNKLNHFEFYGLVNNHAMQLGMKLINRLLPPFKIIVLNVLEARSRKR